MPSLRRWKVPAARVVACRAWTPDPVMGARERASRPGLAAAGIPRQWVKLPEAVPMGLHKSPTHVVLVRKSGLIRERILEIRRTLALLRRGNCADFAIFPKIISEIIFWQFCRRERHGRTIRASPSFEHLAGEHREGRREAARPRREVGDAARRRRYDVCQGGLAGSRALQRGCARSPSGPGNRRLALVRGHVFFGCGLALLPGLALFGG